LPLAASGEIAGAVGTRMADSRWRVRAAALETATKRNLETLHPQVSERLRDADLFVRVSAVAALASVSRSTAEKVLLGEFERQHELKAPILRALLAGEKTPPGRLWDALWTAPPEVILQCLETLDDRDDREGKRIPLAARFGTHPNPDVAASALRLLASRGLQTGLLLEALRSGDDLRRDAVLDSLRLPAGYLEGASAATESAEASGGTSALDRLYAVFSGASSTSAPAATEQSATPAEMRAALERYLREGSPRQRFQSAVALVSQDHDGAAQFLLTSFETLSSLDRRLIAAVLASLGDWKPGTTLELATRLLRDPADDVREKAIESWLNAKKLERFTGLLAELARPGSLLQPDDLYGYEVDTLAQQPASRPAILNWSRTVLADASLPEPISIFAIVLLGRSGQAKVGGVEKFLEAERPWLRRAAYRALGASVLPNRTEAILRDEAAPVRAVLPFLASPQNSGWLHWFSDAHGTRDLEDQGERDRYSSTPAFGAWAQKDAAKGKATLTPEITTALEKLARDPSETVRFEAQFALLRLGRPVDPSQLAGLIAGQPETTYARERLGNFLETNYLRLGKAYGVLVPLVTDVSEENVPKLLRHFRIEQEKAFTSFAALAQLAPAEALAAQDTAIASTVAAPAPTKAQAFRAIFFYKVGCRECDRVRDMLQRHASDLRQMQIEERDINTTENALLNEALAARFNLRDTMRQVTPAVFTQSGALVKDDLTFPRLGDLLRQTETLAPDPRWAEVAITEVAAAEETITRRYGALSIGVVAAAGLLDGVNPCAFATIIFLLSYLQVARRTPREILAVGAAFILGVFLTYFLVGLGLTQVLGKLAALRYAGTVLNYVLAAFALVVALLSFRDAKLAAQGQHGEMTLQLPGMLKERIRSTVRSGTRATRFIAAAFGAGIVISLLELACTGQVYLPTILYMLRSGESGAVAHLVLYNVAFVVPLIVVFILAWSGLRSEALIRFQNQHTTLVKILTGVLFLLLAALLVFGSSWSVSAVLDQAAS
jgi:cytochrome c biogenesis protein CcdA